MQRGIRQFVSLIAAPAMSVALLAGITSEQRTHLTPQDVEPFHECAKIAIEGKKVDGVLVGGIPSVIGTWTGKDEEVALAAQKLLKPNSILSRTYQDNSELAANQSERPKVSLLIDQCRDSRDMVGHYPPICYRAQGMILDEKLSRDRDWVINGMKITGHEYKFTQVLQGQTNQKTIYNFFVIPGRGIVRDMKGVEEAAEDYQQRYYGAAQFQVVFGGLSSSDRSRDERDEMFAELIGPNLKVIETLTSGALK